MNQIDSWISCRYGSRRGFARTWWYRLLYLAGRYKDCRRIDWSSVERLVFVCKGNICRSAYAEAVARLQGVDSISCGVETRDGFPAHAVAIKIAATKGFDLRKHRTTPIQSLDFRDTDLFVAMEPWQIEFIHKGFGKEHRCSLLGLWGEPVNPHIQDPYGASTTYFSNCFDYIEKSAHEIARKISEASRY